MRKSVYNKIYSQRITIEALQGAVDNVEIIMNFPREEEYDEKRFPKNEEC